MQKIPLYCCIELKNLLFTSLRSSRFYQGHRGITMTSETSWSDKKNSILTLPQEERRKLYADYVALDSVKSWKVYATNNNDLSSMKHKPEDLTEFKKISIKPEKNSELCDKVSIFKGDITKLEVDAIVNAANSRLKAGGGVDGAIHRAAGKLLQEECNSIKGGCPTGQARTTGGYNLPAKYVIHTVGPQNGSAPDLKACYDNTLSLVVSHKLKSIAFPCISTGIYGFPNRLAAHIALQAARTFLEQHDAERIIFCTFMPIDVEIYETLMQLYFPVSNI